MASAQALRLAHPPLQSAARWPKFASRALGGAARGGRPFKKLFTQQLAVPACEQQPREEGTEGHTLRRAGRGKETEGEKRFCDRPGSVQQARGLPLGGSAPVASVRATKPRPFGEAPNGLAVRESDPCAQLPRGLHVAEPPGSLPED